MNFRTAFYLTGLFLLLKLGNAHAQTVVLAPDTGKIRVTYRQKQIKDSIYNAKRDFVTDSIMKHTWLFPDSLLNKHMIMDSIINATVNGRSNLIDRYKDFTNVAKSKYRFGKPMVKGQVWVLLVVAVLLILFGVLKVSFTRQLQTIVQSFFSNRVLHNLNKEDNLFTSWPFLLLFIQFGFTLGMFFYLVSQYYHIAFTGTGIQFYLTISVLIIVLYVFKIGILRVMGHLFNIQKTVNEYVTILYLSYFNLSLMFIPLVIAFSLSPLKYAPFFIVLAYIVLGTVFAFQLVRAGVNILSNNKFSKVYLFLYFCALEICPVLILIKAIGL
ncbi:hypothetical protein ACVWYN_000738 [Pedobacter sp. UYP24]